MHNLHLKSYAFLLVVILLTAVTCTDDELGQADPSENYSDQIEDWKNERISSLKEPTGWLRLAGMFILNEGENSFGSSPDADHTFPGNILPGIAGSFILEDNEVLMNVTEGVEIKHDGDVVDKFLLYDGENTPSVTYEGLEWFVIVRGEIIAIRLYNKENAKADAFSGFPSYPVDPKWSRRARFVPSPDSSTITIVNVLGQIVDYPSPGTLEFTIEGNLYTLDALDSDDDMFIIAGDQTNKTETYPAGRYIYVDYPESDSNITTIDFNKIYNPPCAYTSYSTCQLPPPQNRLKVDIEAGEKRPIHWSGL
jgi:uncharacterized protein (DUF1684 family)